MEKRALSPRVPEGYWELPLHALAGPVDGNLYTRLPEDPTPGGNVSPAPFAKRLPQGSSPGEPAGHHPPPAAAESLPSPI